MSEIFETLFGSKARARILRLFLLNAEKEFSLDEATDRTLLKKGETSREIARLVKIKLLRERSKKGKKIFAANPDFPFFIELRSLLSRSRIDIQSRALRKIRSVGEVRLVLTSGLFLNYPKSKADMILVVNNPHRGKLQAAISFLEAEAGREVRFVLMNAEELQYRLDMMDRFLMEFLESPHDELINKVPELKRFVAGLKR